jgi:hypothetical protein
LIAYSPFWFAPYKAIRRTGPQIQVPHVVDEVIAILGPHAANFYHFHIEMFSFLVLLPPALLGSAHVAHPPAPFIGPSLKLLGLQSRSIPLGRGDSVLAWKVYIFKPYQGWRIWQPLIWPAVAAGLRKFVLLKVGPSWGRTNVAGFVSRPMNASRHFPNTHDIVKRLEKGSNRMKWTVLEKVMTLIEGAREFRRMDVLMAAHGAGCTLVLFMRERSVFIEIQAKTWCLMTSI